MRLRPAQYATAAIAFAGTATILAGILVGTAPGSAHDDGRDARGPLDIRRLSLKQHRSSLDLDIRTAQKWSPRELEARPAMEADDPESYLCLELRQRDEHSRWCVARGASGKTRLIGGQLNEANELRDAERLAGARVRRHGTHTLSARFRYSKAGLGIGDFGWRGLSGWGDPSCAPMPPTPRRGAKRAKPDPPQPARRQGPEPESCRDQAPDQSFFNGKIVKPRIVGCTRDEDMFNTNGSRSHKRIALTFDDGPSSYTGQVLDILHRRHVHGTFFEVGQEIRGRARVMRRIIASGHEIGNHSLHHETSGASAAETSGASAASLRETSSRIRAATGFTPCLYRPPGGYVSASTSRAAWQQGMSNILWDVDPQDWSRPGSGAIYSRVVGAAHSGSIVLMHDGGGDRSQTVAALDHIIGTLRDRGYRLVTVTKLLGERFRWKP